MLQTQTKISNQTDAIVHFIQTMDIEMINAFLDDSLTYQDFEKYLFVSKLQEAFEIFKSSGDTKLNCHHGVCEGCNEGCNGFSFIGNLSNDYLDMVVETADGKIKDLYECSSFRNTDTTLIKNERIYIDDTFAANDPF